MENNSKQKMLLAALSQCVADRDKAVSNIASILEQGYNSSNDNIVSLKAEFEKMTMAELSIESMQVYYGNNMPLPKEENKEIKEDSDNGNNS